MRSLLTAGAIPAAAEKLIVDGKVLGLSGIPKEVWPAMRDERFWSTDFFQVPVGKSNVTAFGVKLDPHAIIAHAPPRAERPPLAPLNLSSLIEESSPPTAPPSRAKGGRPAGKHGEPIARVTKRLFKMSTAELSRCTTESVATELIEEYRKLGVPPPHMDNARRDAAGILRAVRDEDGETG